MCPAPMASEPVLVEALVGRGEGSRAEARPPENIKEAFGPSGQLLGSPVLQWRVKRSRGGPGVQE
jgi:hypothetical protein